MIDTKSQTMGTNMNTINFFWSGDNWTYLHNLTIKSHLKVGHNVVIWLHGDEPNSVYWDNKGIDVYDADNIVSITDFMKKGGNFKTASSLWRFTFLFEYGGWYSDTDAIAVSPWHEDEDWILASGDDGLLSTGIMKVPAKELMFLDMLDNLKYTWGNVKIFNDSYTKYKGNNNPTCDNYDYFPFKWNKWEIPFLLSNHKTIY